MIKSRFWSGNLRAFEISGAIFSGARGEVGDFETHASVGGDAGTPSWDGGLVKPMINHLQWPQ